MRVRGHCAFALLERESGTHLFVTPAGGCLPVGISIRATDEDGYEPATDEPIVLPRGIYDIADGIPPTDVPMLAGTVDVAVREGLHPYVIYSLLEAMAAVHRNATLVSGAGAYPTVAGTDLIRQAYQTAIAAGYRFYSYGDAMLIL